MAPFATAHPVRGILTNRPFDFSLTKQQLSSDIRLGIVCPKAEARQLQSYLQSAQGASPQVSTRPTTCRSIPGV